jgi:hypothetical protein
MMQRADRWIPRSANAEAGNTLVVVLLVLFLLTSLGISYVALTKGDKQIAGNQMVGTQAFANAEAGISEALLRMSDPSKGFPTYIGQTPGSYTPGWGAYIVTDPGNAGLDPQYDETTSDGLNNNPGVNNSVDEASEHYPEVGSMQNGGGMALADRLDYPWVKVRYKLNGANQIVLFGDDDNDPTTPPRENTVRGVPKIIITSAGRKGLGAKNVTVEAVKWPLPPVPGSVYTEGQLTFTGASFLIDGHDHEYTAPYDTIAGSAPLPGISTPNDPNAISGNLSPQQQNNVEGSGTDPSVQSSGVNLDLAAMAAAWSDMADITLVGDQINIPMTGWGSVSPMDLKIVHIAGDLTINGVNSGAGVLIVDGDFHMGGTLNWNGIVICLQDVDVSGGGAAKQIVGSLMVQGTLTGNSNVNGNIKLLYSSAMIQQLSSLTKYEISSWIDQ